MVITEKKPIQEVLNLLGDYKKIFLVGCGECATICKTGGETEVKQMRELLEKSGKTVVGLTVVQAPCVGSQAKMALAKNMTALKDADAVLVLACGLGAQSITESSRLQLVVISGNDTQFLGIVDAQGNLLQRCSACAECVLGTTANICPVTLCAKSLLNGPCGGMNKGKCEVNKDTDCAWVLIYQELSKQNKLNNFKKINPPRNFRKTIHPRQKFISGDQKHS